MTRIQARPYVPRFTRAADIASIPYLGPAETRFQATWTNAWGNLRSWLRSPDFATHLEHAMAGGTTMAMSLVEDYVAHAAHNLDAGLRPIYTEALDVSSSYAVEQIRGQLNITASTPPSPSPSRLTVVQKARSSAARAIHHITPHARAPRPVYSSGLPSLAHSHNVTAANNLSLKLVTAVTERQRQAIRRILVRSINRGIEADRVATQISDVTGLFPRWQTAVDNLLVRMLTNHVPEDVAYERAQRYADELLRKRGLMIARTELMRALNDGRALGWHASAEEGWIDPQHSLKLWVAQPDACDECLAVSDPNASGEPSGVVEGIDTPFATPFGDVLMPPLHPHCRCTVTLLPARPSAPDAPDESVLTPDAGEPPMEG